MALGQPPDIPSESEADSGRRAEATDFLQARVARFALFSAGAGGFFWLFRLVLILASGDLAELVEPSFALHAAACSSSAVVWLLCRRSPRSESFIHRVELVGFVGSCISYELMGLFIPPGERPEYTMLLALSFTSFARALYVPSSARRTILFGVLVGFPLVAMTYLIYRGYDFPQLTATGIPQGEVGGAVAVYTVTTGVWWGLSVLVAVAASEVLEALRATQMHLVETQSHSLLVRLIAGIAHEVNTPLGALRSSADTIDRSLDRTVNSLERGDQAQALKFAKLGQGLTQTVHASSTRIENLVENLKRFGNLDDAEYREVDLRDNIESTVVVIQPFLAEEVTITRSYPDDAVMVRCFPVRLNNALLNLLQNAVEALHGAGSIALDVQGVTGGSIISISDTGRGIAAVELAQIFDIGFSSKQRQGRVGLRLGLPYARRVVEELGGSIKIESVVGEGTTVRLRLPRNEST